MLLIEIELKKMSEKFTYYESLIRQLKEKHKKEMNGLIETFDQKLQENDDELKRMCDAFDMIAQNIQSNQ